MNSKLTYLSLCLTSIVSTSVTAGDIYGQVVDTLGQPITGVKVEVESLGLQTKTDQAGRFSFADVTGTEVEIHAFAPNFVHFNSFVSVADSDAIKITLQNSSIEIIDVHATPFHASVIESALPVSVITGDALRTAQANTLGDTLDTVVGVNSNFYAGVASSPIIRGLDGPRVLVSQNGLDAGDASRVGPDHVVATETVTAQQIEILRGPATLFYGSGAIGGVVNIVDERVPSEHNETFTIGASGTSVNDEKNVSFMGQTQVENWAFYADGFWRDSEDYDIPGMAELHEDEHHDDHDEEHDDHGDESMGTVENSGSTTSGFTLGTSYISDNGFAGVSIGRIEREYGIPGHSHGGHADESAHDEHDEHDEEMHEDVIAEMEQDRMQMLSEYRLDHNIWQEVHGKFAYTDYRHAEIEDGEVGTEFTNTTLESRIDLLHKPLRGWKGGFSFHYKHSDFAAQGEEAFTPESETTTLAIALLEEKHVGDWLWQLGARIESVELEAHLLGEEHVDYSLDYNPVSFSAGFVWDYADGYNVGASASYAQRALSATELFAFGPHIATQTYEVGAIYEAEEHDDHLDFEIATGDPKLETSQNFDLSLRKFAGDLGWVVNVFYNQVDNYAAATDTGFEFHGDVHDDAHMSDSDMDHGDEGHDGEAHHDDEHGHEDEHDHGGDLPIYLFTQQDAKLYGIEAELHWRVNENLKVSTQGDWLRAKYNDGTYIPRMPAARLSGSATYETQSWDSSIVVQKVFEQDNVAGNETHTEGYTLVDVAFNYYTSIQDVDVVWYAKVDNLFDEEARVHTSVLKNQAPLPGRSIKVGFTGTF